MVEGFTWLQLPVARGGVLDLDDPDAQALLEEAEVVAWIEEGAPPVEGSEPVEAPALPKRPVPVEIPAHALAVNQKQAAALLGVHPDTFRDKVLPHLRVVDITGRTRQITIRELERFLSSREGYALRSQR